MTSTSPSNPTRCFRRSCNAASTHVAYYLDHNKTIWGRGFCEPHYNQVIRLQAYYPTAELAKVTRALQHGDL